MFSNKHPIRTSNKRAESKTSQCTFLLSTEKKQKHETLKKSKSHRVSLPLSSCAFLILCCLCVDRYISVRQSGLLLR